MWGIPAFVFLFAFLHRVAPGVVAKDIMRAFDIGGGAIGQFSAMYFYAYAGFMIPAGLLLDSFGVRRVYSAGAAIMGLGSLAIGLASGQAVLFGGRFLVGLGAAVTFIGCVKVAAAWFPPSQFATMSAVTATVGVLGSLVGTVPLAALVVATGWRGAFLIIGAVTLAGALACFLLVRDHPRGHVEASAPVPGLRAVLRGMIAVLRNRDTWPPFLVFLFVYSAVQNLLVWCVPFLRDVYGLGTTQAAGYASAPSFALLVSAPLLGYLSDRVLMRRKAPYAVMAWGLFATWTLLVLTLGALPLWGLAAVLFAMGAFGSAFVLTWPIAREVNPPHLAGTAVAVSNLGGFIGASLTQGPVGAMLDHRWTGAMLDGARVYPLDAYRAAFTACALFTLAAGGLSLLLRETGGRNVHHELHRG
jgi:MFS family permease